MVVIEFIENYLEYTINQAVSLKNLHEKYEEYSMQRRVVSMNKREFLKEMTVLLEEKISSYEVRIKKKGLVFFRGLFLKKDGEGNKIQLIPKL